MKKSDNHKKSNHRNRKFRMISFKLSPGQYRSLIKYCKARHTTPIKLIKSSIGRFITNYEYDVPAELYITENQLQLFDEEGTNSIASEKNI